MIILLTIVGLLVVLIIVCGATFLVRHVDAYGYYQNSGEYDKAVIEASGIEKSSSMFFIDETAVKNRIESKFANIGVINVERKFPDRVTVNYVVYENSFSYFDGGKYYNCYANGKIGSVTDTMPAVHFEIKPKETTSKTLGAYFQGSNGLDRRIVGEISEYMYSLGLNDRQIAERIAFVDMRRDGYVYVRTTAGCSIEIHNTGDKFATYFERCWSAFSDPNLTINKSNGTIRPRGANDDEVGYAPDDGEDYYRAHYVK